MMTFADKEQPGMLTAARPVTARAALRAFWEADSYPILGNEDERAFERLMAAAMDKVRAARLLPGDPPEFAGWLALLRQDRTTDEREDVVGAIHDFFRVGGDAP